jgi:hypothetical protein
MPLMGEAKRAYQREYMRRKRAGQIPARQAQAQADLTPRPREQRVIQALVTGEAKTLSAAMVKAGFNPTSRTVRDRFRPGGDLREVLDQELTKAGLTLPRILGKVAAKLDARKHVTVAGEAIITDDNDAQLRATDQALRLHERAGTIPASSESHGPGASITVIEVNYHTTPPIEQAATQTGEGEEPAT